LALQSSSAKDTLERTRRQTVGQFTGDSHLAWFEGMFELPVTSFLSDLDPAVVCQQSQHLPNFHVLSFTSRSRFLSLAVLEPWASSYLHLSSYFERFFEDGLTLLVTCRCSIAAVRIHSKPQAGGGQVQRFVETVEKPQITRIFAKKVLCFQWLFF
jgi:hypothetical protein